MERIRLPAQLISTLSEVISEAETHTTMESLFMYANAPGDPPSGNKQSKAQDWLRRINTDENIEPLEVIGFLIEGYMELHILVQPEHPFWINLNTYSETS